jgi:hypothetical protein
MPWNISIPRFGSIGWANPKNPFFGGSSSLMDFPLEYYFDDSHRGDNSAG